MKSRAPKNKIATKTNPKLWESIKRKWIRGSKGGAPGKVSARKMQLAVQEYKRRGGGYRGSKGSSLVKWTKEKWGYISPSKRKSKVKSRKPRRKYSRSKRSRKPYGRYLPLKVRKSLTKKEKSLENKRKGYKYGKRVPYSTSVKRKMRKLGIY